MTSSLAETAARCDTTIAQARADLIRAVRQAAASGMPQSRIASEIGRSQPEVHRLLHFNGTSPRGRALRRQASAVRRLVADRGGRDVRVFGSVAAGKDGPESDIDLLFTMKKSLSLMQLAELEIEVSRIIGVDVDMIPESAIRPDLRDRILAESVPL